MGFRVVVPSRYDSTRFAGETACRYRGQAMIVHVAEAAAASGADEVVVATDDSRIVDAVRAAGYDAMVTRRDHQSGSDRIMEVVAARAWPDDEVVLNVQAMSHRSRRR